MPATATMIGGTTARRADLERFLHAVGPDVVVALGGVAFTLGGQNFQALNGGSKAEYGTAASISVACADQAEVDRLWEALTADGGTEIVGVRTPHIGGRLFTMSMAPDGSITERNDIARDLSNHLIGSRELGLSAVLGGEVYLPSQDRRALRRPLSDAADIALPAPIDKAIIAVAGRLVTATEDGKLLVVEP